MNRRNFIKLGVLGTGAAWAGVEPLQSQGPPNPAPSASATLVGMPICIAPLAQRELDPLFDDMRQRAGVNALFPFIYSHEPHRAGVPATGFHGGNYAMPHMEYYRDTPLTLPDMHAPEFGGVDVLARVIPAARRHGIRTFCFLLEDNVLPSAVPHWETLYEVDRHDRRTTGHPGGPCFNNHRGRDHRRREFGVGRLRALRASCCQPAAANHRPACARCVDSKDAAPLRYRCV